MFWNKRPDSMRDEELSQALARCLLYSQFRFFAVLSWFVGIVLIILHLYLNIPGAYLYVLGLATGILQQGSQSASIYTEYLTRTGGRDQLPLPQNASKQSQLQVLCFCLATTLAYIALRAVS